MKIMKRCPKCESSNIRISEGTYSQYGGNYISVSALGAVKVNRYICCDCGYVEQWINREDLEKVKGSKKLHR